ncbi:MAG: DUF4142 domain-containing protein [Pseudomonadota bacterium]
MRIAFATAAIVAALAAPAVGNDMNDLEIAHTAYTAGAIDIRYAHLALAISENAEVRTFAELMIQDHTAVNDAAEALIAELQVTPQDNPLSQQLLAGAEAKRAELAALTGAAFDCAYATNELAYHQAVNGVVEDQFLPAVTVEPLHDLLTDALATFKVHEGHAEHMVEALGC